MIVGHEPFLGKLAARLVTGRSSTPMLALGKPSVACLEHDGGGKDGWRVAWVIGPEQLADRKGKQRGSS
jgi:phosphohistidine phosphatase SixA